MNCRVDPEYVSLKLSKNEVSFHENNHELQLKFEMSFFEVTPVPYRSISNVLKRFFFKYAFYTIFSNFKSQRLKILYVTTY